jgi:hypothetical protein
MTVNHRQAAPWLMEAFNARRLVMTAPSPLTKSSSRPSRSWAPTNTSRAAAAWVPAVRQQVLPETTTPHHPAMAESSVFTDFEKGIGFLSNFTIWNGIVVGFMTLSVRHRHISCKQLVTLHLLWLEIFNHMKCISQLVFCLHFLAVRCWQWDHFAQVFWQAIAQARGRVIGNTTKQWVIPEAYPIFAVIGAGAHCFMLFGLLAYSERVALVWTSMSSSSRAVFSDFLTYNAGAGLATGFMAYSSSTNPFFMVNKNKRSFGDAGNRARLIASSCAPFFFFLFLWWSFEVYSKYDMPERKPLTNSPSHGHHWAYFGLYPFLLVNSTFISELVRSLHIDCGASSACLDEM